MSNNYTSNQSGELVYICVYMSVCACVCVHGCVCMCVCVGYKCMVGCTCSSTHTHITPTVLTLLARAMITMPRLLRLLLMLFVSFNLSPSDPELVSRSEPARSIRLSVAARGKRRERP